MQKCLIRVVAWISIWHSVCNTPSGGVLAGLGHPTRHAGSKEKECDGAFTLRLGPDQADTVAAGPGSCKRSNTPPPPPIRIWRLAFQKGTPDDAAAIARNVTGELQSLSASLASHLWGAPGAASPSPDPASEIFAPAQDAILPPGGQATELRVVALGPHPRRIAFLRNNLLPVLERSAVDYVVSGSGACHTASTLQGGSAYVTTYVEFHSCGGSEGSGGAAASASGEEEAEVVAAKYRVPGWTGRGSAVEVFHADATSSSAVSGTAVVFITEDATICPVYLSLFEKAAPKTVAAFLKLVDSGFYNGTTFYRAEPGFVLQGGARTKKKKAKHQRMVTRLPLEAVLPNRKHTLSMARTSDPFSGSTEFFVNQKHNKALDKGGKGPGYAVFAQLIGKQSVAAVKSIIHRPTEHHGRLLFLRDFVEISTAYSLPRHEAVRQAAACTKQLRG